MDSSIPGPIPRKPLTPRQERFCHYFVLYACASVAASEAGYSRKSAKHQGYRLLRTGRVRARIQALHAEHCRDQAGDTEALIGKLENVYRRAVQDHHFHTAARCVELQARLAALRERRDMLPALPKLPPAPLDPARRPPTARPPTACPPGAIVSEAEVYLGRVSTPPAGPDAHRTPTR